MPYALVLHCFAADGRMQPDDLQGQKTLALFLQELVQKQDAAIATRLHAPHNPKPFTTALLTPPQPRRRLPRRGKPVRVQDPRGDARAPHEVKIRITLLDDALYPLVLQFFLQHLEGTPVLRLGQTPLIVSRVLVTPESGEPWAGCARFADLLAAASETETAWTVHFATPTAFKAGDAELPLPIPRLCFQSWLQSWDAYAPFPFFAEQNARKAFLAEVVEAQVSITYAQLRGAHQPLYFDGSRTHVCGFVGTCRFAVRPGRTSPASRKLLATLVRYSYYAGTGRKTTMGMGLTKPLEEEAPCRRMPVSATTRTTC
ncbi:MAG: hypothetical protein KatS3mg131_3381 [Candidatus Tectimicrobiota bacterium]|nr:MAG: hypothetical protein KatS3mg131_3381 [Candidatus Tectomicrobia bacterium]